MRTPSLENISCSFCGRNSAEVQNIIAGPNVYICDNCILNSSELLRKTQPQKFHRRDIRTGLTPIKIKEALDEFVIGQEHAKKILSVAVYNHYKRLQYRPITSFDDVEIEKSNVLLIGQTGTGKTLLAQTLARILDVPFAIADATTLTEAGYVGDDVESVLVPLLQNCDYNIERVEFGIVYIDEIDKIARRGDSSSITRDVSGEGVQQGLLKILEGTIAGVPPKGGRKHPEQPLVNVNTKNILFICGGAFEGLETIVSQRLHKQTMGFGADVHTKETFTRDGLIAKTQPDDLLKFGLIPEFIGRFPVLAPLHSLDEKALMSILTEPKNAIVKQYKKLLEMEGVDVEFKKDALQLVVKKAIKLKTGARGLRSIIEEIMLDVMYHLPAKHNILNVSITKECIEKKQEPTYVFREALKQSA
jgi:ATP-dependent Clp protease ATP-binding subunit ClpX